jgi:hypothetical protein
MMEGKWGTTPWEETSTHCGRQIKYTFADRMEDKLNFMILSIIYSFIFVDQYIHRLILLPPCNY